LPQIFADDDFVFLGGIGNGTYDLLPGAPVTGTPLIRLLPVLFGNVSQGDTYSVNWTVNLTVAEIAAVPLPAGLPLLLAGLGGLALTRKRKTR
jgi:hypothetical protein